MRTRLLTCGCAVLLGATALAQVGPPQVPGRDAPGPQTGRASISGLIVANDQAAQPVRRAILLLNGGGLLIARQSTTNDDGRFVFSDLPAGRYTLTVWRNGFVRDVYGNKRPGVGTGSAIVVAEGAPVSITMKLTRSAALSGTILGMPTSVPGLRVMPFQFQAFEGERRLMPSGVGGVSPLGGGGVMVDDRGVYRLYGLPPGDYLVATATFSSSGPETRTISPEEVRWAQQQFGPRPPAGAAPSEPPVPQPIAYSPVFFPGTTDPAAAAVITLAAGEERSGLDFSLPLVPVARIEGTVIDASGQPPQTLQMTLRPASPLLSNFGFTSVRTTSDGRFTASGVLPGRYQLVARGASRGAPSGVPTAVPTGRGAAGPPQWASMDLDVDGRNLTRLSLTLQPGAIVTGRLVFDGPPPASPAVRPRVSLRQSGGQNSPFAVETAGAMVNPDNTFTISGIAPGRYRFSAFLPDVTWALA
jgi:hypothetical protein